MQDPRVLQRAEGESAEGDELTDAAMAEISRAYEASLKTPTGKHQPQILVCPVGLVGAGKTTVIKPIADQVGLLRISTDDIRHMLKDRGFNYLRLMEIARPLVEKYLKQGQSLALDMDCVGSAYQFILQAERQMHLKVIWLHIAPPETFILHKLRNFKGGWMVDDNEKMVETYFARKPLHEHLDMQFLFVFDTSRADLGRQIADATQAIQAVK